MIKAGSKDYKTNI